MERKKSAQTENTPEKKFDPELCKTFSKQAFWPSAWESVGENIDVSRQFLGDSFIEDERDSFRIKNLTNLEDFMFASTESKFGENILDVAKTYWKVKKLPVHKLSDVIVNDWSLNQLRGDLTNKTGFISSRGWSVFEGKNGNPVLISHKSEEKLEVVDLTKLDKKQPGVVKQELIKHYQSQLARQLDNETTYNLALHDIDEEHIVPEVIEKLSTAEDDGFTAVQNYLQIIPLLEETGAQRVDNFVRGLRSKNTQIPEDGRSIYLDNFLIHKASCISEPEKERERYVKMRNVYARVLTIDFDVPQQKIDPSDEEILKNPIVYTEEFVDRMVELGQEELREDRLFSRFLGAHITDRKGLSTATKNIKRRNPKLFHLNERFKEALGRGVVFGDRFNYDEFVKSAVSNFQINLRSLIGGERSINDLEGAERALAESLYIHTTSLSNKESWIREERGRGFGHTKIHIRDEQLRDLILFTVLKTIQQEQGDALMGSGRQDKASEMLKQLDEKYKTKVERSTDNMEGLHARKLEFSKFLKRNKISKKQVSNILGHFEEESIDEYPRYNQHKLGILFRAIALSKQGVIDLEFESVRSLLRHLYHEITTEEWRLI